MLTSSENTEPTALERAVIVRIASQHPEREIPCDHLRVVRRELTGVGSFTTFDVARAPAGAAEVVVGLRGLICVPGVPLGLCAELWLRGPLPAELEIVSCGEELWTGEDAEFSFDPAG